jgi:hypothetical protein
MDTKFNLDLEVVVKPICWKTYPEITYGIDDIKINTISLSASQTRLRMSFPLDNGDHQFWITYNNKNYEECKMEDGLDMSVEIDSVSFEGITLDRFKWAGVYYPEYPEWITDGKPVIKQSTYLGWNGRWVINFTTPIFTWIHQIENLGWIHTP